MTCALFRTEDVPREDRFDYWRDLIRLTRTSDIISAHSADFWAEHRLMELGPVVVWPSAFLPTRYRRTAKMVRQSDPEMYHLTLLLDGELAIDHGGRYGAVGSYDLHLGDSSAPYDVRPTDDHERRAVRGIGVDFARALLPLPPNEMRTLVGRGLSGRDGAGALLAELLVGLGRRPDTVRPADAARLGTVVLDLISVCFAQALNTERCLPQESRQQALALRIRAFIRQNLHDPELTPSAIAEAHHISLSYLHRIFREQSPDVTVAAWIRGLRLENARHDLEDRSLRGTAIKTVAARWGFARASDFTRAFRSAYGISPREHRLQALLPSGPAERPRESPQRAPGRVRVPGGRPALSVADWGVCRM
ncbi:helix-turn-helix domain-containing protein [Streptomyces graminilatus]|uniref:helix-turn-helix domain-containing protein n=1 Tax=Streptomyces graminilatus TaxID=1464070 RepID=UPI0007C7ADDD|nr:helix-turn-helix domain-containing protein [Streptomyces graminilatus]